MGFRVEPVYATLDHGYRYARRFTRNFLGYADETLQDEPIDYVPGDVFFGLDLQPQVVLAQRAFYQALRRQGVRVTFAVYDLLCVLMPQHFPDGAADGFCHWLDVVAENDGAICISKAVAGELTDWVNVNKPIRKIPFTIEWFHLGADIGNSVPTNSLSDDTGTVLERLRSCNSFLIVGTIEPRKANAQVLDAFEQLWQSGANINLVIVGKQGWMVEALIDRLRRHPEQHKHLFWLEGISDEYLELVYEVSTCLIAASFGEGFGLPLIEAAQHKLPIIARDIPVFREVAGEHAFYFSGLYAENLSNSIKEWLNLDKDSKAPQSIDLPWLTWEQSAKQLLAKIILHQQEVRVKEC
jgi:glycosyltransferase involved in cell wall biosynthesis